MIRQYKVNQHNSTVCGYPGRDFDWSAFDWDRRTIHEFRSMRYLHGPKRGKLMGRQKAPAVYADNESMQAGSIWRGHKVIKQTAIKKDDGWYWQLELEN